jgi:hypothetical protein
VVGIEVSLVDGQTHAKDSSEMAFHRAGAEAIKAALAEGGTQLLEPVMAVTVHSPSASVGDVVGDLNRRHGRIARIETRTVAPRSVVSRRWRSWWVTPRCVRSARGGPAARRTCTATSRYALHEEGEGARSRAPFLWFGRASTHGVDLPGDRVASSAVDPRHAWMGPSGCDFCIASQQNCRKSWIKVMPHDKLRTPVARRRPHPSHA